MMRCVKDNRKYPLPDGGESEERAPETWEEACDLLDEFAALRSANLTMIRALTADQLDRRGIASNNSVSVRALVYIISGHVDHHLESLKKVYLKK